VESWPLLHILPNHILFHIFVAQESTFRINQSLEVFDSVWISEYRGIHFKPHHPGTVLSTTVEGPPPLSSPTPTQTLTPPPHFPLLACATKPIVFKTTPAADPSVFRRSPLDRRRARTPPSPSPMHLPRRHLPPKAVTPRVSNPHDYVNHMFNRP
jgi:hypothetical protein